MQIATWNVNSVRQRTEHLLRYLREVAPDVLCLQELKCIEAAFPREEVEALGYNAAIHGQKGFNGVAILSKTPIEVTRGLPGDPADEHARYIEAVLPHDGGVVRVASIYLPNGNPPDTDKYAYKLAWMDRLIAHARTLLAQEEPLVLAGDYNVIPAPRDCADPQAWIGDALFLPQSRARFRTLLNLGFTDALRATRTRPGSTPSGIIRRAPGSATKAFASTTCCCRRRPPTASSRRPSTRRGVARTSRPTTFPCASSWPDGVYYASRSIRARAAAGFVSFAPAMKKMNTSRARRASGGFPLT